MYLYIKNHKSLTWILTLSFLITAGYSFYFRIHPVVDAQAYDSIAMNLVEGFGFREDRTQSYQHDTSILRAGPGYEFFLAGIYALFGHHYEVVWIFQALLHVLSAWLIFLICKKVFSEQGEKIGIIAAGLFAFWPDLIEISAMLMTETLYIFLTILVVYIFVRAYEEPANKKFASLLGFVTGIGILTRPPLLLFIPIFVFFYWRKKQLISIIYHLSFIIIALLPWIIRNYAVYHQFILTTLIGEYNIWVGNTLASDGGQISGGFNPVTDYVAKNGVSGLSSAAKEAFRAFLFTHPFVFLKICFIRLIRYFSLIRPMGFWFYQTGVSQMLFVASSLIWIAGVFIAGFSGMVAAFKEKKEIVYYLAALGITAPILLLPTVVQSRYRFQIYPFLALFAGYVIVQFMQNRRIWKEKVVWVPTVCLLMVSLVDVGMNLGKVIERLDRLF